MADPSDTSSPLPRLLLVEDDETFAAVVTALTESQADVKWVVSAEEALGVLPSEDWDVVIADVNLPGMSGLELTQAAKRECPHAATLILTASASLDTAVGALRSGADDFLTKPLDAQALACKVAELIASARARKAAGRELVLAIGAHPDDVEIGCGGILLGHRSRGDQVSILTLTGGEAGGTVAERLLESQRAAELIDAQLFHADLADTSLSVSDGGVMIGQIERVISEVKPTVIYTHSRNDVHQDHRNVHDATLVAARRVPRLYCYQAPSASIDFRPTRFVGIDEWIEGKLEVIGAYGSQVKIRRYLQDDLLRATARYWSRFATAQNIEPLEVLRDSETAPAQAQTEIPEQISTGALAEDGQRAERPALTAEGRA
jgi:LmbE family N-acetylglucosaminyl deacetylase/ActR/RegA family two-component response regulator